MLWKIFIYVVYALMSVRKLFITAAAHNNTLQTYFVFYKRKIKEINYMRN